MTKKIILIIAILAIIGVAVILILDNGPQGEGESRLGFSIRNYLPFGSSETSTTTPVATTPDNNNNQEDRFSGSTDQPVPRLRKVSSEPVAGAVTFNIGTTTYIRFIEKGTGNVYEANSENNLIERLTNTTIPKIVRAFWLPNGSAFLAQTLVPESEIIETSLVKLVETENIAENLTPYTTTISSLPLDIKELSVSPNGDKIFYYTVSGQVSNWYTANPDGTNDSLLFTYPLTEWLPTWLKGNEVMMQTKSSSRSSGHTFIFNVNSKNLSKVGVAVPGLSALPNSDGSLSLVSTGGSRPSLFMVNNDTSSVSSISASALADKCVWSKERTETVFCAISSFPSGSYPDDWYKGLVSTEDFIERIDLANDIYYQIANLSSISGEKIDVLDPALSPDETQLIFRNKIDGYLWVLRVGE